MGVRKAGGAGAVLLVLALALAGCGGGNSGGSGGDNAAAPPATTAAAAGGTPTGPTTPPPVPPPPPTTASPVAGGLASRLESDGTTITVGDTAAPHTITIYEDPRCPICGAFEKSNGARLTALAKAGKVKLQYTLASFIDDNAGGGGSKRAVNALRAAVQENAFSPFHDVLYAHQPAEDDDDFTADFLLDLAGQVGGLRNATFDAAVRGQTYADFVKASENAFVGSGAQGTPTVKIDGKLVSGGSPDITTAKGFGQVLAANGIA